jgi:hypothetical protein
VDAVGWRAAAFCMYVSAYRIVILLAVSHRDSFLECLALNTQRTTSKVGLDFSVGQ